MKLAVIFQMGYPGAPTIYYGDKAGLFGARDPDCRRTYPWSKEDQELLEHYRKVATIRTMSKQLFADGDIFTLYAEDDVYIYGRKTETQYAVVAINRGEKTQKLAIDTQGKVVDGVMLTDQLEPSYTVIPSGNTFQLTIPPMTGRILLSSRSS